MLNLIPAFTDNYIYLWSEGASALVVDPGSAPEVLSHLQRHNLKLELILVTHHHGDHIDGVAELQNATGARLIGPSSLARAGLKCDDVSGEGFTFAFHGKAFRTLEVPGHTLDHLAYVSDELKLLFCGDTLFSLGCGRLFEGTAEMMFNSLAKFGNFAPDVRVCCAHEYTLKNAEFSLAYMKQTQAAPATLAHYESVLKEVAAKRASDRATVPSTLEYEREHNLFLRAQSVEEFAAIRVERNGF